MTVKGRVERNYRQNESCPIVRQESCAVNEIRTKTGMEGKNVALFYTGRAGTELSTAKGVTTVIPVLGARFQSVLGDDLRSPAFGP